MSNLILSNVSSGYLPLTESHNILILKSIINILVPASIMTVTLNVSLLSFTSLCFATRLTKMVNDGC